LDAEFSILGMTSDRPVTNWSYYLTLIMSYLKFVIFSLIIANKFAIFFIWVNLSVLDDFLIFFLRPFLFDFLQTINIIVIDIDLHVINHFIPCQNKGAWISNLTYFFFYLIFIFWNSLNWFTDWIYWVCWQSSRKRTASSLKLFIFNFLIFLTLFLILYLKSRPLNVFLEIVVIYRIIYLRFSYFLLLMYQTR